MYKVILLDADGTLFDYDRAEESALKNTLLHYGFTGPLDDIHRRYRRINAALWRQLELGEITKDELRFNRFHKLFLEYNLSYDEEKFSARYLKRLGDSLTSDIRGGLNSGIDTCWFNPKKLENDAGVEPTYSIASLGELSQILR